jgi:hypothetical protein
MSSPSPSIHDALLRLDAALADPGFWRCSGVEEQSAAEDFAHSLDADGWASLDALWRERPVHWQRCLATVVVAVRAPRAVPWLLEMIVHGADELAIHAIDELRDLQRSEAFASPWPSAALDRVRDLWRRRRGFSTRQLDELIDDMARGRLGR